MWLDGKPTGEKTPALLTRLVAKEHDLVLRRGEDVVYQKPVKLSDGKTEQFEVDISRLPPLLEVLSTPLGAKVTVDGKDMGVTPVKIDDLQVGKANVKVTAENGGKGVKLEGWLEAVMDELSTPSKRPFDGLV